MVPILVPIITAVGGAVVANTQRQAEVERRRAEEEARRAEELRLAQIQQQQRGMVGAFFDHPEVQRYLPWVLGSLGVVIVLRTLRG